MSYHDQTHYCTTLKIWRKIDLGNLIVFSGPTRNSVDRYKNDFSMEHQIKYTLFRSKSHLNQSEKSTAEEWKRQQRIQRDEKEATEYFEKHISSIEGMNTEVLKLEISLSFDKKYFARKSLSFRNIFAISIRLI